MTPPAAAPALSAEQRRALRAQAHHLNPVVAIAGNGASPAVLKEIDRALNAHELIKVRLHGIERDARNAMFAEICAALQCHAVQHIGNLLVLWREKPADGDETTVVATRRKRSGPRLTKQQEAARLETATARRRSTRTR